MYFSGIKRVAHVNIMKKTGEAEIRLQLFLTSVFDEGDGLRLGSDRFISLLKRSRNTLCLKF
jgi:hypothetical protein